MSPRELYGLVTRLTGLAFLIFAAFAFVHALATGFRLPFPSSHPASEDLLTAIIWLILGLILTLGAERLTRLAYGAEKYE
jgi:hypothetical protein